MKKEDETVFKKNNFWVFWLIVIALLVVVIASILVKAKGEIMPINWEEVNSIKRQTEYEKYEYTNERRKITPSVQTQLDKFDQLFGERPVTEEDFHQNNEKIVVGKELPYLQKALAQTLRWRSFCQASS